MPSKWCPFCAAQITYEAAPPTKCPKCHQELAAAFKVKVATAIPSTSTTKAKITASAAHQVMKPKTLMRPVGEVSAAEDTPDAPEEVLSAEEVEEATYINPHEVHATARELAASIDPSTIHIADEDEDQPVKFRDWCATKKG